MFLAGFLARQGRRDEALDLTEQVWRSADPGLLAQTMAAAAWESSDDSSIIRTIFLKEDSARIAGLSLKDELNRGSILDLNFI